jgi:hypothetical protein
MAIFILFERCVGKGQWILMKFGMVVPFNEIRNPFEGFSKPLKIAYFTGAQSRAFWKKVVPLNRLNLWF